MAGHSKWANTKHRKAKIDEARAKIFGRLIREITIATKSGNDPALNSHLRLAILKAKSVSVPSKNIEAAINKGSNDKNLDNYFELTYEGYGPQGVSIIVDTLTNNKTRTVSNMRFIFSRHNGNIGETGSVSWMFKTIGNIIVAKDKISEEKLFILVIEAGVKDIQTHEDVFEIITSQKDFHTILEILKNHKVSIEYAEIIRQPDSTIELSKNDTEKTLQLIQALESNEDVQNVFSNLKNEQEDF